jgi:hypothetical protein
VLKRKMLAITPAAAPLCLGHDYLEDFDKDCVINREQVGEKLDLFHEIEDISLSLIGKGKSSTFLSSQRENFVTEQEVQDKIFLIPLDIVVKIYPDLRYSSSKRRLKLEEGLGVRNQFISPDRDDRAHHFLLSRAF